MSVKTKGFPVKIQGVSMKAKFVALGLASLLVVVAWFAFAFRPAQSKLSEVRADVRSTQEQVADLEAQLQRLLGLQRNEAKLRSQAARMLTALPAGPSVSAFILQVQDAANAAGIDFLSITPSLPALPVTPTPVVPSATTGTGSSQSSGAQTAQSPSGPSGSPTVTPASPLRSISVQITANGAFFEIEQFILRMEQLVRAVKIDDLALSAGGEGEDNAPGRLSANMKLQMFMLAPQAAAGSTPATPGTPSGQSQSPQTSPGAA